MSTRSARRDDVARRWYLVDAAGLPLGRLASAVAHRLRGKHKPVYTPHVDTGDFVVVVNATRVAVTGRKDEAKMYHRHSGYIGGLKSEAFRTRVGHDPEGIVRDAVAGMLPKNPLGRSMLRKLKIYGGAEHPHAAQNPESWEPCGPRAGTD
ncbi:MAG: 50S ribosomal protein L13 [Gammaproteobacteria bacterium]|jgi:large subunit ribosomal protein L13|nr:50S ribosomal protein L13 [Gammaproteobacteria bacterium]